MLGHGMSAFFESPFFYPIHGRNVRDARGHFFALRAVRPELRAVLLLDGDNRDLPDHDTAADDLTVLCWERYEIENYLLHPDSLLRFISGAAPDIFSAVQRRNGEKFLRDNLPPAAFTDPLRDSDYLIATPSSKTLIPGFLRSAGLALSKRDYFQIAATMKAEEIHPEVKLKLDEMQRVLLPATSA